MNAPIEKLLDAVAWQPVDVPPNGDGIPVATHSGVLTIGGSELRVYTLSDGRRIIDADDLEEFFSGFQ